MTDIEKRMLEAAAKHPQFDREVCLAELENMKEHDFDLIEQLWELRNLVKNGERQVGNKNKLNSSLAYYLGATNCRPESDFEIYVRRTYGRSGFPDIDMDFDYLRRQEIIDYLIEKYGREYVGNIGNVQTLKIKAALRRAIKTLDPTNSVRYDKKGKEIKSKVNANFMLENEILKTLPSLMKRPDGSFINSVDEAYEEYPNFKKHMDAYPDIRRIASAIEGTISGFGVHAAGILLSPIPLCRIAPLHVTTTHAGVGDEGPQKVVATQFPMNDVESMGLIKFDILGLSTKTAIDWACKSIKEERGIDIDWNTISVNDPKTLELLNSGKTDGCFQLEKPGMKECLKMIGIDSFDDLVVAVAMYRPGPKDYIPEFSARKRGNVQVVYPHPLLKDITEKTHGIICYQEDTLISMADGSEKPINQIQKGDKVHSVNLDTGEVEIRDCHGCQETNSGDGLLITLENGYQLLVTPGHEILTYYGMREAHNLEPGRDLIACPVYTPTRGSVYRIAPWLGEDERVAYLLGQLTGDGNVNCGCSLACGLKKPCDNVEKWLKVHLPRLKIHKYFHCCWHLGISCDELVNSPDHGNRKTKFHILLEETGLKINCYSKSVPTQILQHASHKVKSAYLAGLLDSDGSITESANGIAICHITSQSPKLISDIRNLLQSLGIAHQVRSNRVHIWDTETLRDCVDEFLVVRSFPENLTSGKYSSRVPARELRTIKDKEVLSGREFASRYKISRSALLPKKEFVCFGTAEKCGISSGHLRHYHIASIEKIPDQKFWGMSVDEHHNLIANGIVAKNCYQEQVMQVFMTLAGLAASDGYDFMKGCAKKKIDLINKYKDKFFKGSATQGIDKSVIQKIWNDLYKFSGYAFNKSHSVSYAYESFKTAYLKSHYPAEFIAARLSVETVRRNFDDVDKYERDAKKNFGFTIEPPSLNTSKLHWSIVSAEERILRKPLLIKGVGVKAAEEIIKHQPYRGKNLLLTFTNKVGSAVNAKVMEAMKDAKFWEGISKERLLRDFEQLRKDKKRGRGEPDKDMFP